MKINGSLLKQMESDLGLNFLIIKGQDIQIRNCWHFSSDGKAVNAMFIDEIDFKDGMNRIYAVQKRFNVVILAFSLMDTHVHFLLYGELEECKRFMHELLRRTSIAIFRRYGERNKLQDVPINYQCVDTDRYFKIVVCYIIKNAPVAGIHYNAFDYPWSSGSLYFRNSSSWTSPRWLIGNEMHPMTDAMPSKQDMRILFHSGNDGYGNPLIIDGIVFPGEYVAYEIVERMFRTHKGYNYFLCKSREDDVDSRGGSNSYLSIPMSEMRQNKTQVCLELFGIDSIRILDINQRLKLARVLKSRYGSSTKQIARLCGLVYEEIKDII